MTQNPENARRCPMPNCGRVLKPEEKYCPICRPAKRFSVREPVKPRTEVWYCADCMNKIPPEFQTCPICRTKTHIFCPDCGTLIKKNEVCPICGEAEEILGAIVEKRTEIHEALQEHEPAANSREEEYAEKDDDAGPESEEPGTSELDAEAEQAPLISGEPEIPDGRKNNKLPLKKPDGRKQPWSEERKDEMRKLRQAGRVGKAPKKIRQTQTEAKKDALKKTQAAKKPDGRKSNGQKKPWSAKKQATKEAVEPEAPQGHPNDIETVILKSRYGEFIATDIASLQILKQIIAIVEHDLQPAKGALQ